MPYLLSTSWIEPGKTEQLREWGLELVRREDEVLQTLRRENTHLECGFLLSTDRGDLLCVFLDVDEAPGNEIDELADSPFPIDHEHMAVMQEISGGRGRVRAELLYAFENPREDAG